MTKYASVANDSANPTNNNRKGQKRLTDEEAAAAGVDFSGGPQMSKSPFYRTGVSRSPFHHATSAASGNTKHHKKLKDYGELDAHLGPDGPKTGNSERDVSGNVVREREVEKKKEQKMVNQSPRNAPLEENKVQRTNMERKTSPLEMHYKNADGNPQPHGYDLKKPKKSKKEASTSGVPKSYGLIIDKEDWDEFAKRTVKNKTSGLPMQSDSPLYKSTSDRIANRLARKTARIERRQERKAGKARVARTKGNNALSNNNLSTEQKQRKALTQRKKYDKKMSKVGDTYSHWKKNDSGQIMPTWYDKGGAELTMNKHGKTVTVPRKPGMDWSTGDPSQEKYN